eukprot:scaffold952_cov409-Prasinococcus_capsulatus_cf.AAC.65
MRPEAYLSKGFHGEEVVLLRGDDQAGPCPLPGQTFVTLGLLQCRLPAGPSLLVPGGLSVALVVSTFCSLATVIRACMYAHLALAKSSRATVEELAVYLFYQHTSRLISS